MIIIPDIVEQHAEESSYLWLLRYRAATEPAYSLQDLAHLDDRAEAHIDGLCTAGDEGWEICKDVLTWEEAGGIFIAALLAFESGIEERIQAVIEAVRDDHELSRGIVSALGWLEFDTITEYANDFMNSEADTKRCIGLAAYAIHRKDPGTMLPQCLKSADNSLRARALKALGELGNRNFLSSALVHLDDQDEKCRFYAAWSAAILGNGTAVPHLQQIAENGELYTERACDMTVRRMKTMEAHEWLNQLSQTHDKIRTAIKGYGAFGDPKAIAWLIEMMEQTEFARPAAEALINITGVDFDDEKLEGEWPEGFEAGPTENPDDEDVDLDPDEDLLWPAPEVVAQWWNQNKNRFQPGTRYLVGKPITEDHLQDVLRTGYQRQRAAAAIELSILQPGRPLFEVRAPGFRQKKWLGIR